jgi:hypothetical protein
MRLVQLERGGERRVAIVDNARLRLLRAVDSVYALASSAAAAATPLETLTADSIGADSISYEELYELRSEWRLLPSFDHPHDVAHCMVSGTGLTHKASALNRAAMHERGDAEATDSFKMFRMGLDGGTPAAGQVGVQPEWFFKGNGSILRAHGETLAVPEYALDGGEEPEIAGVYLIAADGVPRRVGFTTGNEFSDHRMEKQNYLYLAPSKLRQCSIGPELIIGVCEFENIPGTVSIERKGALLWSKEIWTGQDNMSHSVANLEHHHFKYRAHREPGDAHVHFFGADAFSFGDGLALAEGDVMQVSFPQFGRPLRNVLKFTGVGESLMKAVPL